jgi:hypothetical protein
MHFQSRTLLAVAFLVALAASPAIAWGATCCNTDIGTGRGSNNGSGGSGAPGPIAGAGLAGFSSGSLGRSPTSRLRTRS